MAITKNLVNIGDANISNTLTAEALKKRNGTNKQILLADGTTKDMGTSTTTFLRNDGTWATPPTGTDEKVKVNTSTTNARFPLMAVATSNITNGGAYQAIYDAGIVINPNKHSVAEGQSNAIGWCSHAEGDQSVASGVGSHAEGYWTTASGENAHAEGGYTSAIGIYSHAEGYLSLASGTYSHAEGYWTTASGEHSHAEGMYTNAIGSYSHTEGYETTASGTASHAGGYYTIANVQQVTAIGRYNSTCSNGDLFIVGNGSSSNARKTVFKVSDSGSSINGGGNAIVKVTGEVNATQGFFQTSDINKKNIIRELDLDKAYDLINKCQTILYTLKDDDSDKEQIGLIAQEVKDFFPELITEDNDGSLSLDYSRLSVVILKVLKDVINRIKILESKYIETY